MAVKNSKTRRLSAHPHKAAEFAKLVSEVIRFHRKSSGLNQNQLAKLAGVGKTAVFDLEHSKSSVQLDTLIKVLDILNIQLEPQSPLMNRFRESKE